MSLSIISCMKATSLLFVTALILTRTSAEETLYLHKDISCKKEGDIELNCTLDSSNPMGSINFNESLNSTGWDTLYIKINPDNKYLSSKEEMYAIGWAEGFVTFKSISDNYDNTMSGTKLSRDVTNWINEHINYMNGIAEGKDKYATQLARLLEQLKGLESGYKEACAASDDFNCTQLELFDIFVLNFQDEVGDVQDAFQKSQKSQRKGVSLFDREHCSALIKPVKDDIFVSHVTWSGFVTMYRQYKTYNLGSTQFVTMSGYPGVIHSIDDWYMTGARLVVMETTNGVFDNSLFVKYLKDNTMVVSAFLRTMIANYLAGTPKEWVDIWSRHPSGTYNNQWMVFDMKQYTPNQKCPKGTFYIVETVPGTVKSGDMSDVINKQGYWASYNLPYFQEIRNLSGVTKLEEETGDFFSYTKYARAQIFKRNHTHVTNMSTMMNLMRYNNYKHDNLSLISNCTAAKGGKCNPPYSAMLAIASRGDLNPPGGTNPIDMYGVNYRYLTQRPHCGTDAKIASYNGMMRQNGKGPTDIFTATVVSGPTTSNGLPPFEHAKSPFAKGPWKGLPTGKWEFPDVVMRVDVPAITEREHVHDVLGIGIGIVAVGCAIVFLTISILIFTSCVKEDDHVELV